MPCLSSFNVPFLVFVSFGSPEVLKCCSEVQRIELVCSLLGLAAERVGRATVGLVTTQFP